MGPRASQDLRSPSPIMAPDYIGSTLKQQSICNISEIAYRKTQLQFKNIYRGGGGGGGHRFRAEYLELVNVLV